MLSPSKIQSMIEAIDRKSGKNRDQMQADLQKIYNMSVEGGGQPGAPQQIQQAYKNSNQIYGTPPNRGQVGIMPASSS
jgi:hypothetical protein